ncbi:DUF2147 domain-containing protein [Bradyrhizobium sp. Tv2a-2]|uniref:DUF2147 domain-containing protein n=1 Tax=Bradyrhizobium sp. Tv2a-2 TaxID=113395 RepID=UPI00040A7BB3|nr:DUF2147 domain-containing protein [Bradyrhizobium sp. Tv2a-2]
MKRLLALTAFLLASSAAQAQYSFQYGGHTIHIDPDRGTVSIPGIYDNTGRKSKRTRNTDQDSSHRQPHAPQEAKVEPQAPAAPAPAEAPTTPAPQAAVPAVQAPGAPVAPAQLPTATTANNAPADTATLAPPPAPPAPAPAAQQDAATTPQAQPAPNVVVLPAPQPPAPPAPPPAPPQQTATAAPAPAPAVRDPNSPVGVWLTEEKEGKVRIEQCGANLCGYSVDSKSNLNGEQVLINMKPGREQKWSGRILDPNTGSTYDSTIALKGPDTLRVQGCAFGGMFCGGQTWTRVN